MAKRALSGVIIAGAFAFGAFAGCVPEGKEGGDENPLGRLCSARLTLTGAMEETATQPEDVVGCWPVGKWKFTAVLDPTVMNECEPEEPQLEPEYVFQVTRDEFENETYLYLNDPGYERVNMKVTSGGGGLCEGGLEIFSLDGLRVLNLKPALHADRSIAGFGEWDIYDNSQWGAK